MSILRERISINVFKPLLPGYFVFFSFISLGQSLLPRDYYPSVSGQLVEHTYYALDYNEQHEQANWVIYYAGLSGSAERKDQFKADPLVLSQSAQLKDYRKSGYDRGHLAPAADMSGNELAMSESFFLSNMSPQNPSFNRGIWKELESLVRNWSIAAETQYDIIITGPVLKDSCGTIGDHVTVPCSYYKIYANLETCESIGFVLKNEASSQPINSFVIHNR